MKTNQPRPILLLTVGSEGGKLDVFGLEIDDAWHFGLDLDERTLLSFDETLDPKMLHSRSGWMTWDEVLEVLDRDDCWSLYVKRLHPLIAERIEDALNERPEIESEPRREWTKKIADSRRPPRKPVPPRRA